MERAWMTQGRVCFFLFLVLLLACGSFAAELYDFEDARFDPDMVGIICSLGGALLCLVALLVVRRGTLVASEGGLRADAWRATLLRSGGLLSGCLLVLMLLAVAAFVASLYDFEEMRVDIDMPDALFPLAAFFLLSWLRYRIRAAVARAKEEPAAASASPESASRPVASHEHARMAQELEELKKRVEIDPLTGLLNKAALTEKITRSLHGDDTHCALFMVDMDNFKSINDTYGHQAGDTALVRTGEALREAFRRHEALVGRVGGDEFMALLFGIRDEADLESVRRNLRSCLQIPIPQSKDPFTGSIGCVLHEAGESFESLYARADKLLYEDKRRDGSSPTR
ncbi:GGDEF domain-containing protein [Desulfovibrio piger]|nr:GGDEF domain-containing protein [Desulfovibrio piger]